MKSVKMKVIKYKMQFVIVVITFYHKRSKFSLKDRLKVHLTFFGANSEFWSENRRLFSDRLGVSSKSSGKINYHVHE